MNPRTTQKDARRRDETTDRFEIIEFGVFLDACAFSAIRFTLLHPSSQQCVCTSPRSTYPLAC